MHLLLNNVVFMSIIVHSLKLFFEKQSYLCARWGGGLSGSFSDLSKKNENNRQICRHIADYSLFRDRHSDYLNPYSKLNPTFYDLSRDLSTNPSVIN